jgi:hypothetical protein
MFEALSRTRSGGPLPMLTAGLAALAVAACEPHRQVGADAEEAGAAVDRAVARAAAARLADKIEALADHRP